MTNLFSLSELKNIGATALLSPDFSGCGYLVLLFVLCAAGVIIGKITLREIKRSKNEPTNAQQSEEPPKKSEPKTPTEPKTVYYLVEKKRTRPKNAAGTPKKIRFD